MKKTTLTHQLTFTRSNVAKPTIASLGTAPKEGQLIAFPREYRGIPPNALGRKALERIHARKLQEMTEAYIEAVADEIGGIIGRQLAVAGFPVTADDWADATLIHEAVASFLCKGSGILHPLQEVAAIMAQADDGDDGGA
jgi:hypothetical protein